MSINRRLENITYFLMDRALRKAKQYSNRELQQRGFDGTVEQWVVLIQISENPGISQREIASSTHKDAPTLTRILDLMSKKGLVERRNSPDDRRKYEIYLTDLGNQTILKFKPVVLEIRAHGLRGIPDQDIEVANRVLDQMFENFD